MFIGNLLIAKNLKGYGNLNRIQFEGEKYKEMSEFRDAIDAALGKLYPFAGYVIDDGSGGAVSITANNALSFLAFMKSKFSRGNNIFSLTVK